MRLTSPIGRTLTKNNGFTLLEIITVIVLIAVISALVWPEMHRSIRGVGGKSALHQVQRDLALLADEAKGTGQPAKAVFTPGSKVYCLKWGGKSIERPLQGLVFQNSKIRVLTHSPSGSWVGPAELNFRNASGQSFSIATGATAEEESKELTHAEEDDVSVSDEEAAPNSEGFIDPDPNYDNDNMEISDEGPIGESEEISEGLYE